MSKEKATKIKELIPDNRNMNKGTEYGNSLIEKSFRKFGAGRSILIDKNNRIIAGNKSIEACSAIGLEDLIIVETTGEQIVAVKRTDIDIDTPEGRELALADNASAKANIEWDAEAIKELCEDLNIDSSDWGIELEDLLPPQADDDGFSLPENISTDIKEGDLFEIGMHKLLCGDATKAESYKKLLGDEKIDLVVTDPPYNVDYEGKTADSLKIKNDKMSDKEFFTFLSDFHNVLYGFIKPGGGCYIWHADSEGLNFRAAFQSSGLMLKQCIIWVNNSMVMGRQDYQWRHEPCLYGWKPGAAHYFCADRSNTTVLEFNRPLRNGEHPTMKPVELISELILNSSKPGWLVEDSFLGSGSTMVAAHQLKRRCYGMELDPKYCQVIIDRMILLDPTLEILKNGVKYESTTKQPEAGPEEDQREAEVIQGMVQDNT